MLGASHFHPFVISAPRPRGTRVTRRAPTAGPNSVARCRCTCATPGRGLSPMRWYTRHGRRLAGNWPPHGGPVGRQGGPRAPAARAAWPAAIGHTGARPLTLEPKPAQVRIGGDAAPVDSQIRLQVRGAQLQHNATGHSAAVPPFEWQACLRGGPCSYLSALALALAIATTAVHESRGQQKTKVLTKVHRRMV